MKKFDKRARKALVIIRLLVKDHILPLANDIDNSKDEWESLTNTHASANTSGVLVLCNLLHTLKRANSGRIMDYLTNIKNVNYKPVSTREDMPHSTLIPLTLRRMNRKYQYNVSSIVAIGRMLNLEQLNSSTLRVLIILKL